MTDRVQAVIDRLESFVRTVDDALALPREAAAFMHAVVLASRVRTAVEIGTSYGYSGLWIASALPGDGKLLTIDHDPRKTEAARRYFGEAGLLAVVDLRVGTAIDLLHDIEGPIDFVLVDADKVNCIEYVRMLTPKLSDRAVVLTDNTLTHTEELAEFIAWIRRQAGFVSTAVPVGNGTELSVYDRGS